MTKIDFNVLAYTRLPFQLLLSSMTSALDTIMTVKEVADFLRVNQRTVYRLAVEHRLPGFKVGATWRFKRADIDGWIAAQSLQAIGELAAKHAKGKAKR